MKTHKFPNYRLLFLICSALLMVTLPVSADLFDDKVEAVFGDPALKVTVNHEAKRQTLAEAITALQKQSGVNLAISPDCQAAQSFMTARFKDISLADVLKGMASTFGVSWRKEKDVFVMKNSEKTNLEIQLQRLGNWDFMAASVENRKSMEGLGADILQHFGRQKLEEGIKFSEMPPSLQKRFLNSMIESNTTSGVMQYYKAAPSTIENSILKIKLPEQSLLDEPTQHSIYNRMVSPHLMTSSGNVLTNLPVWRYEK